MVAALPIVRNLDFVRLNCDCCRCSPADASCSLKMNAADNPFFRPLSFDPRSATCKCSQRRRQSYRHAEDRPYFIWSSTQSLSHAFAPPSVHPPLLVSSHAQLQRNRDGITLYNYGERDINVDRKKFNTLRDIPPRWCSHCAGGKGEDHDGSSDRRDDPSILGMGCVCCRRKTKCFSVKITSCRARLPQFSTLTDTLIAPEGDSG